MQLPVPLNSGNLLRRYKRFLADIRLDTGEEITAHCPNPGRMIGLTDSGSKVWLSCSDNPKRKLQYTLELMETNGSLVGINTTHPNNIVSEAIKENMIPGLYGYKTLRREVNYGQRSRIDILLDDEIRGRCWVEVKNVHLRRDSCLGYGTAEFPDSVTERGARHINEIVNRIIAGDRGILIFLVQRMDCRYFKIAKDIDPNYYQTLLRGVEAGLEVLCFDTAICLKSIKLRDELEIILD